MSEKSCPACGSTNIYEGLTVIECPTPSCENYTEAQAKAFIEETVKREGEKAIFSLTEEALEVARKKYFKADSSEDEIYKGVASLSRSVGPIWTAKQYKRKLPFKPGVPSRRLYYVDVGKIQSPDVSSILVKFQSKWNGTYKQFTVSRKKD